MVTAGHEVLGSSPQTHSTTMLAKLVETVPVSDSVVSQEVVESTDVETAFLPSFR